jgi:hypothetical protein
VPNRFSSGKFSIAQCDRCGFRFKLQKLKSLTIKTKSVNILVCPECWEADHPQLKLGMYPVNDPQAVRNPRSDVTSYPQSRSYTEVIYNGVGVGLAAGTLATNGLPPTPPTTGITFFSGGFYAGGFYAGGYFSVGGGSAPPAAATTFFSGGMYTGGMFSGGFFSATSVAVVTGALLTESGDSILLESGDRLMIG